VNEVTATQVAEVLRGVGVEPGDGVLVHAAIQYLGRPSGGVGLYWDAFREVLGEEGTLAVPTFNFGFARGLPFDPVNTASEEMGVFAEYVRGLPEAKRSSHPLQSVAAVGRHADDLARRDTPSAFDPGSAFERMLDLDFKMVLLGASIKVASIVHYSEQKNQVPYRCWKDFEGTIVEAGRPRTAVYRMFARDLELDPRMDFTPVQLALEEKGRWTQVKLNYGKVAMCPLREVVAAADELLRQDPWVLVGNRGEVEPGRSGVGRSGRAR
jgi:aminoglycoside N3'-acetyltransferase